MYTIIAVSLLSWGTIAILLIKTSPHKVTNVLVVLTVLFFALSTTISIPLYVRAYKKAPQYSNLRALYRKNYLWSAFVSLAIVTFMGFRAFEIITPLNILLFSALYAVFFFYLKSMR